MAISDQGKGKLKVLIKCSFNNLISKLGEKVCFLSYLLKLDHISNLPLFPWAGRNSE